jgi:hypothetical protein
MPMSDLYYLYLSRTISTDTAPAVQLSIRAHSFVRVAHAGEGATHVAICAPNAQTILQALSQLTPCATLQPSLADIVRPAAAKLAKHISIVEGTAASGSTWYAVPLNPCCTAPEPIPGPLAQAYEAAVGDGTCGGRVQLKADSTGDQRVELGVIATQSLPAHSVVGDLSAGAWVRPNSRGPQACDALLTTLLDVHVAGVSATIDCSLLGNVLACVNDAKGPRRRSRRQPNCKFSTVFRVPDATVAVFVITLCEIPKGDELLLDYGAGYWSAWSANASERKALYQRMDREALTAFEHAASQLALPTLLLPPLPPPPPRQYTTREYRVEQLLTRCQAEGGEVMYEVKWGRSHKRTWETEAHLRSSLSPGVLNGLVQELTASCGKRNAK